MDDHHLLTQIQDPAYRPARSFFPALRPTGRDSSEVITSEKGLRGTADADANVGAREAVRTVPTQQNQEHGPVRRLVAWCRWNHDNCFTWFYGGGLDGNDELWDSCSFLCST